MRGYISEQKWAWQSGFDLIIGLGAGALAVLVSNPLWVVNTRLKLQGAKVHTTHNDMSRKAKYTGIIDCLCQVSKQEGWRSLWSALLPSLILVCNPAIQFMAYEALKSTSVLHQLLHDSQRYFILGAIAKIIATIFTYPLQVHQTCIRAGVSLFGTNQHVQLFTMQWLKAQYRGLEAKLTQTVLTSAMMFMSYEKINLWILTKLQNI
ncbi:hypothetical protein CAPTEDRAFT_147871 [Capitella teleta]|uniref:Uncharacterized protein n=1 Tax=Capitella teleta TaxID=283909 RepID=R7TAR0_CAPTE|nr:hypothetical protein CAPTEDRAFT_147871 [Capitella teleta]|eukprot:ELT88572.1 hypothetical protein CAPTEDRAFT_147871 [Capitella teleta]